MGLRPSGGDKNPGRVFLRGVAVAPRAAHEEETRCGDSRVGWEETRMNAASRISGRSQAHPRLVWHIEKRRSRAVRTPGPP
jgi:hypothetical protein